MTAIMDFLEETRIQGEPIYLGILGSHQAVTKQDIHDRILHPIISELGRLPDKILLPSEGLSSGFISFWAECSHIETQQIEADWKRFQRKAGILRDSRILKESTHLIVFSGARSKTFEATAIREARKGKVVFLVDHSTLEVSHILVE